MFFSWKLPDGVPLPAMVWIHGGGYCIGTGNSNVYGPSRLMDTDIVLISLNHRLGALGKSRKYLIIIYIGLLWLGAIH